MHKQTARATSCLAVTLAALAIFSCTGGKTSHGAKPDSTATASARPVPADTGAVLLTQTADHLFSSAKTPDHFELTVTGASLVKGTATLKITNGSGDVIYSQKFPASYLMGMPVDETAAQRPQEELITSRAKEFFAEANFGKPAIGAGERFDGQHANKANWDEIQSNPGLVGFTYPTGIENNSSIAWSAKQGKVVVYFSCC
ncbi:hypothetical protein [Hufsiella ginkgonis]|uniref:Uncharacterized protein n=1 Tax=Hufsiella ginkgonis TaxID=2695274 RepID=A0A7K1XZM6_9SPHI|nr:hypothetical protein [Hufsiella ginkgonis]MXV16267.1 hypothetical protein [Hufsiella ginkgonis]